MSGQPIKRTKRIGYLLYCRSRRTSQKFERSARRKKGFVKLDECYMDLSSEGAELKYKYVGHGEGAKKDADSVTDSMYRRNQR